MTKESTVAVARAIGWALDTLRDSPGELPKAPAGWSQRAEAALAHPEDERSLTTLALEMRAAHSQYSADFDRKVSLYEIRRAVPGPLRDYIAEGLPVAHLMKQN